MINFCISIFVILNLMLVSNNNNMFIESCKKYDECLNSYTVSNELYNYTSNNIVYFINIMSDKCISKFIFEGRLYTDFTPGQDILYVERMLEKMLLFDNRTLSIIIRIYERGNLDVKLSIFRILSSYHNHYGVYVLKSTFNIVSYIRVLNIFYYLYSNEFDDDIKNRIYGDISYIINDNYQSTESRIKIANKNNIKIDINENIDYNINLLDIKIMNYNHIKSLNIHAYEYLKLIINEYEQINDESIKKMIKLYICNIITSHWVKRHDYDYNRYKYKYNDFQNYNTSEITYEKLAIIANNISNEVFVK